MNKKIDIKKFTEPIFSLEWWWSWFMILFGCTLLAAGYVFFISPYNIVPGGIYGASIVLHNIFPSIQVGTFGYMFDIPLMILAFLIFGGQFGSRTIVAALYTPGIMNILTRLAYPNEEALQSLDPSQMLGGILDLSNHLMLASFIGSVFLGVGVGIVVRQRATTGGTDIVAMMIQKYFRIGFSKAVLLADSVVVLSGLLVIGFGFGTGEPNPDGWMLSFYSLVTIYVTSRVLEYVISGASSNRLLFIIFDKHNEELRRFILHDLDRSATYVKAQGMYSGDDKEMIFLVVPTKNVPMVQHVVKECDPRAFIVITDAYDTFGEGFKPLPGKGDLDM
ncbi:MAG: YitT family protein [Alistipes sp.]|nr:YitT family protein [Alistipes sp.]